MEVRKILLEKIDLLEGICGIKIATANDRLTLSGIEEKHKIENSFMFDFWYDVKNQYKELRNLIVEEKTLNNIAFYSYEENMEYIRSLFQNIPGIKILRTAHIVLKIMNEEVSKKLV
ncbi:hypothetical protein [Spiroplasma taiwanense]|uniref:Uncharacterized protein n=1 Tax=Spiroplasma taiwanense CT-1 TaxID=1276220 RepID=S5LSU9_9MOLU|nr:hypothetical protein [Spiroplasma taiwanense]AGR40739.1 hypothetical protein STAIW_v1c00420 [Spiroplasma taiwanense CT-1]